MFGDIFFWVYKMNEIVNKFLLVGDKFMSEMHLKQSGFTYSAFFLEIQILFTEMSLIRLVLNMIWLMASQKI